MSTCAGTASEEFFGELGRLAQAQAAGSFLAARGMLGALMAQLSALLCTLLLGQSRYVAFRLQCKSYYIAGDARLMCQYDAAGSFHKARGMLNAFVGQLSRLLCTLLLGQSRCAAVNHRCTHNLLGINRQL